MLSRLKTALKRPPQHDGCLSLEFDSTSVYSPGSTISGVVHLQLTEDEAADRRGKGKMRGGTGRKAIDEVVVRLRVLQVSTYQHVGAANGMSVYSGASEYRTQHTLLLAEDQVLWRSDCPVDPSMIASSSTGPTSPLALTRTISPRSFTSDASVDADNILSLCFSFRLPSWADQLAVRTPLPPTFEGGSRSQAGELGIGLAVGNGVGRTAYYVKVVGIRSSRLARDERIIRPFLYFPPNVVDPCEVPPPLVAAPNENGSLPIAAPPAPHGNAWRSVWTEKHVRMGAGLMAPLSAKGIIRIEMVAPSLEILPPHHPIPFHLSMIVQSPPIEPGDTTPPQLRIPPPSTLSFDLVRTVETKAQGARQLVKQFVEKVGDIEHERRVWYGETVEVNSVDGQGQPERRWSCTVVVVGEFYLGGQRGSKQLNLSPSFSRPPGGGLGCKYSLTLHLPLKGTTSDFWVEEFLPLAISSRAHAADDGDFLPAYFADGDDDDLDFEDEKKS